MRRTLMLLSTMMLTISLAGGLALVALSPAARADVDCQPSGSEVVCTFTYTGAAQSWTVPEGITQATLDVFGAQGGSEPLVNKPGGGGGWAHATIAVTPGDTLQVNVGGVGTPGSCSGCGGAGGAGGFNGGAAGGSAFTGAGGGGGASDIRTGDFALADRIIVAGGGGGAGASNGGAGGAGGDIVGGDGNPALGGVSNGQGGLGGTASSGGEGGAGGPAPPPPNDPYDAGDNGTLGVGGAGGSLTHNRFGGGGGGGGGGYYGGGGGGSGWQGGGGGGGSGYGPSGVVFESGVQEGNGLVTITYTPLDSTAPTVSSINRASSTPTNTTGNVDWTVTFSENVTGVDTGDFALVNSGLGGSPTISSVTQGANASVYTVTASSGTGSGTLGLNLNDDDSIADGAGNKLGGTGTGTAGGGETGNGSFTGEVYTIDRAAPTVSCSVSPSTLRVPANNHKLVDIKATVTVTDNTGGSGANDFTLFSVGSSQPESGLAPDDVPTDIKDWTTGTADTSGQVRAERYGGTRTYTLTYRGTDLAGNTADCLATVTVPKGGK